MSNEQTTTEKTTVFIDTLNDVFDSLEKQFKPDQGENRGLIILGAEVTDKEGDVLGVVSCVRITGYSPCMEHLIEQLAEYPEAFAVMKSIVVQRALKNVIGQTLRSDG